MRADRLLSILLLLQVHRRLTARELAERLEVSERTILRDMEALSAAGVPVLAERGAGGGWSLMEGYRTDLTGLDPEEAQALFLAGPARLMADLGLDRAAEGALLKLLASLPSAARRRAEHARQRIHIDVTGWNRPGDTVPCLPALQEAVWQDRRIRFLYGRDEDCPAERTADPLGLVAKGNVWYLAAAADGGIRAYRVSRVQRVEILDEPCVRPERFDLAAWWPQHSAEFRASFPSYFATLRVPEALLPRVRFAVRFARVEGTEGPDAEGRLEVSMRFQSEEEAAELALGLGAQAEVLEPHSLREKVIRMAAEVVAFYAGCPPQPAGAANVE